MTDLQIVIRILLSGLIGGLIGLERELHGHDAGLRTHILVCVGSALIMLTSVHLFDIYKAQGVTDPARIAAGVVTGIGFLGAGSIMRSQDGIKGLTTASSLWIVAALGLSIGCGFYLPSVVVTVLVLVVLLFLRRIENRLFNRRCDNGS